MIILHAGAMRGRLLVWGERPNEMVVPSRSRPGPDGYPRPRPHWYDAGAEALGDALDRVFPGAETRQTEAVVVWLPSRGIAPIASSPTIAPPPSGTDQLAPWVVSGQCLHRQDIFTLLSRVKRLAQNPDVRAADDFKYWIDAARFGAQLVAKRQYLPDVHDGYAKWRPLYHGRSLRILEALASRMLPASRAIATPSDSTPPEPDPKEVLGHFVDDVVDTIVRSSAGTFVPADPVAAKRKSVTVHDAWLNALKSAEPARLTGDPRQTTKLAADVEMWRRPLAVAAAAPYRVSFRLEAPKSVDAQGTFAPASGWFLRFLLQRTDDAAVIEPLEAAWGSEEVAERLGAPNPAALREVVRTALGQAALVFTPIASGIGVDESETASHPIGGVRLDNESAHAFLAERARSLMEMGFGVQWPAWWSRNARPERIKVFGRVSNSPPTGGSALMAEIPFDVEVALGDETLTDAEIEALAAAKRPLVRLRGRWLAVDAEQMEKTAAYWREKKDTTTSVRALIQMALGADQETAALPFAGVRATGWLSDLLQQLSGDATYRELEPPEGFIGTLRPYQIRGFSWLRFLRRWGLGACLADDMGLGKTIQALAHLRHEWNVAEIHRPLLVVCPTSVVNNWPREAARFTPDLPVLVHHGPTRDTGDALVENVRDYALVVTSYGLLHRDYETLEQVEWQGVILDEAQHIKNPDTKQAKAARNLKAEFRAALTGTPIENNVADLWSIFAFLNPGLLGTKAAFKRDYFVPIQSGADPDAIERLKRVTRPFVLRRLKTDKDVIADLPDKIESKEYCNLTREQASLYGAVLAETEASLSSSRGIQRRGVVLATLTKLKQICNHPSHFLGEKIADPKRSGKFSRLVEMLQEMMEEKYAAIIFTQFREMGFLLQRDIEQRFDVKVPFLHGGVPKAKRDQMVDWFQTPDGPPIFLLSLRAGGIGLNLTRASHVFHYDRWWNPAVENQATDRAYRIGQDKTVHVHKFMCPGTLEERIDQLLERKQAVANDVVGTGEGWLTELSDDELRDVLSLSIETPSIDQAEIETEMDTVRAPIKRRPPKTEKTAAEKAAPAKAGSAKTVSRATPPGTLSAATLSADGTPDRAAADTDVGGGSEADDRTTAARSGSGQTGDRPDGGDR